MTEDIENKVERLFKQAKEKPEDLDDKGANKIFQDIRSIMEEAEAGCRKFHTGLIEFSGETKSALSAVRYWQMAIKKMKGRKVNTRALK